MDGLSIRLILPSLFALCFLSLDDSTIPTASSAFDQSTSEANSVSVLDLFAGGRRSASAIGCGVKFEVRFLGHGGGWILGRKGPLYTIYNAGLFTAHG